VSEDWRRKANCRDASDADRNLAFGLPAQQKTFVGRFCRHCPVAGSCLEWAVLLEAGLPVSHRNGVFGGWTAPDRAALAAGRVWPCRRCGQLVAAKSRVQVRCVRCQRAVKRELAAAAAAADGCVAA